MYKFIKCLFHSNIQYSHVAYLYQDMNTQKYYLSIYTPPCNEDTVDNSNQFMLLENTPKVSTPPYLKNISKEAEVTPYHFMGKKINDYLL